MLETHDQPELVSVLGEAVSPLQRINDELPGVQDRELVGAAVALAPVDNSRQKMNQKAGRSQGAGSYIRNFPELI